MKQPLALLAVVTVAGFVAVRLAGTAAHGPMAVGDLASHLIIAAPGKTAALVQVNYVGVAGKCLGQTYKSKSTVAIPAGSSILVEPGPGGDGTLPGDCEANAAIDAVRGDVVAMVLSGDDTARRDPTRLAAYVARTIGGRAGARVALPRLTRQAGATALSSRILAMNTGAQTANAVLNLVNASGKPIPPTACAECAMQIAPGATGMWDTTKIGVLAGIATTSGLISADQPLAVMVEEADASGRLDLAQFTGLASPGDAVALRLPRLLRFVDSGALGTGDSLVATQNLSLTDNAVVLLQLDPHAGGAPSLVDLPPIQPLAAFQLPLAGAPLVANGSYAGVVSPNQPAAALGRNEWAKTGALAIDSASLPGTESVVPFVAKAWHGLNSLVVVYNADPQARAPVSIALNKSGDGTPLLSFNAIISPRQSLVLDLAAGKQFETVPANFTGSVSVTAQGSIVVQSTLAGVAAVAAFEGVDPATARVLVHAPLVYAGPAQPTPTPTSTNTDTPTATFTPTPRISATPSATVPGNDDTPTPSATPRDQFTATATNTTSGRASATPTPARTRVPTERHWTKHTTDNSDLPANGLNYTSVLPDGSVWVRVAKAGSPDQVVLIRTGRPWQIFASQRDAVDSLSVFVRDHGTLKNFWAVDDQKRIWVGPSYCTVENSRCRWTDVAKDETQPGSGQIRFDKRVLIDSAGQAAVPFQVSTECPLPTGCDDVGVRGYALDGQVKYDLRLSQQPEAGSLGLEVVHMVPGLTGHTFSAPSRLSTAPQQAGQAFAVSQSALYVLPNASPVAYPHLEEPPAGSSALRNAGFASAATMGPDGRLVVFTWVEEHAPAPSRDVTYHVYANTWTGTDWQVEDLTGSPLFNGNVRDDRVTAATFCGDGALWLSAATGTIVARHTDNTWEISVPGGNSEFSGIVDAACDGDGTLWMATESGLLQGTVGVPIGIYLPYITVKHQLRP